ncbi:hypothetical protein HanPSC8_Chr05g0204011 [Helianthus annuus]|nr:hypothetical protein HanPSC8_Chr05g0204011 [Helianthus annuus]
MKSIAQAKSTIGHAIMLLLQVGVLENFKSITFVSGLDLASFVAAISMSSAGFVHSLTTFYWYESLNYQECTRNVGGVGRNQR